MTEHATLPTGEEEATPPGVIVRTFRTEIVADGDGRTIEGLIVPYGVEETVTDPHTRRTYREVMLRGAFRNAVKAPNRVLLDFEHYGAIDDVMGSMGSLQGTVGHATALEERPDGLYGSFRVLRCADGDKVLELAREGVLTGFSVASRVLRSVRSQAGVMQRVKAHLDRVSICRVGAYEQARVLAMRSEVVVPEEDMLRINSDLLEGLARFVEIPARLKEELEPQDTEHESSEPAS